MISGSSLASVLTLVKHPVVGQGPVGVTCITNSKQLWMRCRVPNRPDHQRQHQKTRKPPYPVLIVMIEETLGVQESKRKS